MAFLASLSDHAITKRQQLMIRSRATFCGLICLHGDAPHKTAPSARGRVPGDNLIRIDSLCKKRIGCYIIAVAAIITVWSDVRLPLKILLRFSPWRNHVFTGVTLALSRDIARVSHRHPIRRISQELLFAGAGYLKYRCFDGNYALKYSMAPTSGCSSRRRPCRRHSGPFLTTESRSTGNSPQASAF